MSITGGCCVEVDGSTSSQSHKIAPFPRGRRGTSPWGKDTVQEKVAHGLYVASLLECRITAISCLHDVGIHIRIIHIAAIYCDAMVNMAPPDENNVLIWLNNSSFSAKRNFKVSTTFSLVASPVDDQPRGIRFSNSGASLLQRSALEAIRT